MIARLFRALLLALVLNVAAFGADRTSEPIVSRIPRQVVESRGIATVGYSRRLHALEIEFRRGGTYRYLGVPPTVHRALLASTSKAHFYNSNIRGKYPAIRVRSMIAGQRHP